jgi:hypothetical protein
MKAYYLLAPVAVVALAGCAVDRPVAVETVTPTVAVAPTYQNVPATVVVGTAAPIPTPQGEGLGLFH